MATETTNHKAAEAEAKAEATTVEGGNKAAVKVNEARAKSRGADKEQVASAPFPNAVPVTEDLLPSVEDPQVNLLQSPVDATEGWTVQSEAVDGEADVVARESIPGYYVRPEELPTKEGLAAHGIDPVSYLAGVPVSDAK